MFDDVMKTKSDFYDKCPCATKILEFVDSIDDSDVRWFFHIGYCHFDENRYAIIFKSYDMPEYEDYVLSVEATYNDDDYILRIVKKVDNLLTSNE
ncbi:hypothetical protein ACE3MQ_25225 [Paenibacillus lentus]|uniref:hypothetical protein n=1 Tax=Paenibacillus lentus TaxID=1338368 RepID=UPI00365729C0